MEVMDDGLVEDPWWWQCQGAGEGCRQWCSLEAGGAVDGNWSQRMFTPGVADGAANQPGGCMTCTTMM